jgi:hypothetical protein
MGAHCKPEIIPFTGECIFDLRDMVHPCMEKAGYKMVPNDTVFE